MKNAVIGLVLCFAGYLSFGSVFYDDFEDGDLYEWDTGGRILTENDRVEIVSRHGSKMARVFHDGWTETWLMKTVDFNEDLSFSFDFESSLYSEAPTPDNLNYAHAGFLFHFLDENGANIGRVNYTSTTSTHVDSGWIADNQKMIFIEEDLKHYSLSIQDVLSNISVDETKIDKFYLYFHSYCSSDSQNLHAALWVDNFEIVPEPASALLLILGSGIMLRKRRNI